MIHQFHFWYFSKRIENTNICVHHVYSSIMHNNPKVEETQVSIKG